MALYFLDYDLHNDDEAVYANLYAELNRLRSVRMLDSLWHLERTNTSCEQLLKQLGKFIEPDDSLCVSEIKEWAARNVPNTPETFE